MRGSLGSFKVHAKQPRQAYTQAYHSAFICRISSKQDHPRQSYDVIPIFQDGGHGIAILLLVSFFVTSLIWESRNLPAYEISARLSNPRLRYYYFRFLKTNVRHLRIPLSVPIFTFASPSACHSAFVCKISSKSDHPRQSYDVISIFQDGGHGIAILLPVSVFRSSENVEIYLHTKFRRDISIHGRDITTSGF